MKKGLKDQKIETKRSLYDCKHARVKGRRIYCARGYRLHEPGTHKAIELDRLASGQPLIIDICQACPDFESMGEPLLYEEKGWQRIRHFSVN